MDDWNKRSGAAWRAYERSRHQVLRDLQAAESMRRHRQLIEKILYGLIVIWAFAGIGVILAWRG